MKILYVEDNPSDADLTKRELTKALPSTEFEIVKTVSEAREILDQENSANYDLVMVDHVLPDGNGLDIVNHIRTNQLPYTIVVVTGKGDEDTAISALKAGADDYIIKGGDYLSRLPGTLTEAYNRHLTESTEHSRPIRVLFAENDISEYELVSQHINQYAPFIQIDVVNTIDEIQSKFLSSADYSICDVILIDFKISETESLEFIKSLNQNKIDIPVVLVTGHGSEEIAAKALKIGAADYLVKHPGYLHKLPGILENAHIRSELTRERSALNDSEERFRRLAENALDIIYRYDPTAIHNTSYISPSSFNLTGYHPEEFYDDPELIIQIAHPEDRQMFKGILSGIRIPKSPVEMRWRTKDGKDLWMEHSISFIRNPQGNLIAIQGVARDITDRKNSENVQDTLYEIAQSSLSSSSLDELFLAIHSVLKKILSADNFFIALLDKDSNSITFPYFVDQNDDPPERIPVGRGLTSYVLRTGQPQLVTPEIFVELIEQGEVEQIGTNSIDWLGVPLIVKDTTIGVMAVQSYEENVRFSQTDMNILSFVSTQIAMTIQRKKSEEALIESQRRIFNLMGNLPGLAYRCQNDERWTMEYVSEGCLDLTGFLAEELIKNKTTSYAELIHPDDQNGVWENVQIAISRGRSFQLTYRIITKDNRLKWVWEQGNAVYSKTGEIEALEGFITDVTDRIIAENSMQRRFNEISTLHSIALASADAFSEDELIENVTQIIGETLYPDNFGILKIDNTEKKLIIHPSYRGILSTSAIQEILISEGIVGMVATSRKPVRVDDVNDYPAYIELNPTSCSELCVPIIIEDKLLGVINAESSVPSFFTEEDERLLVTIAGQIGSAIERIRLFAAEKKRRQEAETLRQAATTISSTIELRKVLENIQLALKEVVPYDSSAVFLLEKEGLVQTSVDGFSNKEDMIGLVYPADSALFREIKRTGQPLILEDAQSDPRFNRWGGTGYVRGWMGVPLIWHGEVIGHLTLDSKRVNAYHDYEASLALAFAFQAAAAIQNAKLYQEAISSAERRAILHRASQEIARASQDLERVYSAAHKAATKLMVVDAFAISIWDDQKKEGEIVYIYDNGIRQPRLRTKKGDLAHHVITTEKSILINDLEAKSNLDSLNIDFQKTVRALIAVPLQLGGKIIGTLSCQGYDRDIYTSEDQTLLEMLASHAAAAIENAHLYTETRRRLLEQEILNRISTILRTATKPTEMLPILLAETLMALEANVGAVWLYDSSSGEIVREVAQGWMEDLPLKRLKLHESLAGYTIESGEIHISDDFSLDPEMSQINRMHSPSGWGGACIPIQTSVETIGAIYIAVESPRRISPNEANLLSTISEMAGNAIHRSTLHQRTEDQVKRLTALRDIDTAITSSFDLNVTLEILLGHTINVLQVNAADILLYNPYQQSLIYSTGRGFRTGLISRSQLRMGEGVAGRAALNRKTDFIADLNNVGNIFVRKMLLQDEEFVSYAVTPLIVKGQIKGVMEVYSRNHLTRSLEWIEFFETLAGQAAIAIDNTQLFENLQRTNQELELAYDTTLEGWGKALELRDKETQGHTRRVTMFTLRLARQMGVSDSELAHLRRGVLLHDIGKMGVPDNILHKPGPLSDEEWQVMRFHPQYAYDLLSPIEYLRPALLIPYYHHEKWDGSGYPQGLKGEEIPLPARIFAIIDVYDALTSNRPYRSAWSQDKAREYILEQAGKHFDPKVVDAFFNILENYDPGLID